MSDAMQGTDRGDTYGQNEPAQGSPRPALGIVALALGLTAALVLGLLWLLAEGTLLVESTPPGAEVLVDGRPAGVTPLTLSTRVFPANGAMELRLLHHEPQQLQYTVEPRESGTIAVVLVAQPGRIEVRSEPAGAQVFLEGSPVGTTPLTIDGVQAKAHSLRLVLPDYAEWSQEVVVAPGAHASVVAQMVAVPGEVEVTSTPDGAMVYLDGKEHGLTPLTLSQVAVGERELRVAKEGFVDWLGRVEVKPDGKGEVQVVLARATAFDASFDRPLAVMIDNHPVVRPQSGLASADIVYEAIAEGGITRFLGIFMSRSADVVGPVRSARHYFVYWAAEYDAIFAHCGAYPEAYDAIRASGIPNLDDLLGSPGFWRSSARSSPHNLYTGTPELRSEADRRGLDPDLGSLGGLLFKQTPGLAAGEQARRLTLSYPSGYSVVWEYDPAANDYLRYSSGRPHMDATTGMQLRGSNVVVMHARNWFIGRDDQQDIAQVGSGRAYYFLDGRVSEGTWSKASFDEPTYFLDAAGKRIALNKGGTTWIQVVPIDAQVKYE